MRAQRPPSTRKPTDQPCSGVARYRSLPFDTLIELEAGQTDALGGFSGRAKSLGYCNPCRSHGQRRWINGRGKKSWQSRRSERSEESVANHGRFFAALRMTDSPRIIATPETTRWITVSLHTVLPETLFSSPFFVAMTSDPLHHQVDCQGPRTLAAVGRVRARTHHA
jgi:hypothetical protein